MVSGLVLSRHFGQPSPATFTVPTIRAFVDRYATDKGCIVDPFCGEDLTAHYRNDLRFGGVDALAFLERLAGDGIRPDLVLFDPPYSLRQLKECYESAGLAFGQRDGWRPNRWSQERDAIASMLAPWGHVLSFGWSSTGMGKKRGFELVECLLVNHGAGHHDTICIAERKS